ncbi:unnamed protein product [Meloidogyne enterolobii]|uniref:Uncharacterized protein n=1 Tax=Meloidogyne enterolobii TaxID=390850 RepID=A0ACB0XWA7_MELEN
MIFRRRLLKLNNIFILYSFIFCLLMRAKWTTININNDLIHIFITKSFYYDYITINETKYEKSLIVIFNAEKKIPISRLRNGAVCIIYNPNGVRTWRRAYIEGIIGERPDFECKISVYRLFCPQLPINKNENIEDIDVAIRLTLNAEPFHVNFLIIKILL